MVERENEEVKKVSVDIPCGGEDKVIVELRYQKTLDTVTVDLCIPEYILTSLESWIEDSVLTGEVPSYMTARDIVISQAVAGFVLSLENFVSDGEDDEEE